MFHWNYTGKQNSQCNGQPFREFTCRAMAGGVAGVFRFSARQAGVVFRAQR